MDSLQVLGLALQQPALHHPLLLCKLLATAKRLAVLVHSHCAGCLDVWWPHEGGGAPAAWLAKHVLLLAKMRVSCGSVCDGPVCEPMRPGLALVQQRFLNIVSGLEAGTAAAAAAGRGLQLRSFSSFGVHVATLARLPPSLVHLDLFDHVVAGVAPGRLWRLEDDAANAQLAAALGRLPQLRELELPCNLPADAPGVIKALMGALASLGHVTKLSVCYPESSAVVELLPTALRHLELKASRAWYRGATVPLPLARLTALTKLELPGALADGDTLPTSLLELQTQKWHATSVEPLLRLQHLTRLAMKDCRVPAAQLQRLAALRNVHLRLMVSSSDDEDSSALHGVSAALPLLAAPLRDLELSDQYVVAAALGHVGGCTGLTHLELFHCYLLAPLSSLVSTLAKLTGLQELHVQLERMSPLYAGGITPAALGGGALSAMPRLKSITLSGGDGLPAAMMPLIAGAAQLTALVLSGAPPAGTFAAVCGQATQLRSLRLIGTPSFRIWFAPTPCFNDDMLSVVVATLPRLTHMQLRDVQSVTDGGVEQLSALRELQVLSITKCPHVTAAARRKARRVVW